MSELCEAQETRGSKFIYEFGRNSTVYCFVASENKTAPARKIQNLSLFLKVYQRVEIIIWLFLHAEMKLIYQLPFSL